jgi:predicted NAD/FAD-binding protein
VNGFFAQRTNLVSPSHLTLLRDILRFNRRATALLHASDGDRQTLGDFLESHRFSDAFTGRYLLPMASAIWSASLDAIKSFPALTLSRFFDNHGLLSITSQPTWKVVVGGSHTYIPGLAAPMADNVVLGAKIKRVRRDEREVTIDFHDRPSMVYDDVVFACHGDQVLPLLSAPTDSEREILSAFTTSTNVAWLHTDASVLPAHERARASWNYLLNAETGAAPTVTYDLNRLQGLSVSEQYCVTLNPNGSVDEDRVLCRLEYRHPLYTREAIQAQQRWHEVSGANHTHYCGAYWAHGFHEDGLNSAIRVAHTLGVEW